jgi:putative endonuclease
MYSGNLPALTIQRKLLAMRMLLQWRVSLMERGIETLHRWGERRSKEEKPEHLRTGERGERAAYFCLLRRGCTVVARRWNDGSVRGDVDLIAWDGKVLCFVEVKTRSSKEFAPASLAVDREKRRILRRMARQYLRQLPDDVEPEVRFDIVVVYEVPGEAREVRLIPAAFGWAERRE